MQLVACRGLHIGNHYRHFTAHVGSKKNRRGKFHFYRGLYRLASTLFSLCIAPDSNQSRRAITDIVLNKRINYNKAAKMLSTYDDSTRTEYFLEWGSFFFLIKALCIQGGTMEISFPIPYKPRSLAQKMHTIWR